MEKLKERWGISSTAQIFIIILVFGLTGSSSLYVGKPVLDYIGLTRMQFEEGFLWGGLLYYSLRILVIFPIYQILLVAYGWVFGQFRFFWAFEKSMFGRMGLNRIKK